MGRGTGVQPGSQDDRNTGAGHHEACETQRTQEGGTCRVQRAVGMNWDEVRTGPIIRGLESQAEGRGLMGQPMGLCRALHRDR